MKLVTLKKRREFLRLRGGARFHGKGFVLEGKRRETEGPDVSAGPGRCDGARFGFTVTKRLGGAVRRNGIRRRLKAAVIAKPAAFDMPFTALVGDFETGFQIVNRRLDAGLDRAGARPRRNRRRHGSGNHTNDPSNTAGGNKAGGVGR
jgi:ribonuclease P protein component